MEDWEDEPILPPLKKEQLKNRWDDEDVDENDVKDSWQDEEETALAVEAAKQRALRICRMWLRRTQNLRRRMIWKDLQFKEKVKMRMINGVRLLWINWRRLVKIQSLARV